MKKKFHTGLILFAIFLYGNTLSLHAEAYDPVAASEAIVTSDNMRFTVLTPEMIRIEWSEGKQFENRASFGIVNRKLPVPPFSTDEKNGYLYITTDKLTLRYKKGTHPVTNPAGSDNLRIAFNMDGREVVWYPGKEDKHNLKGTMRTLDSASGDSHRGLLENGILSRAGWAVINETAPRGDGSMSLLFDSSTDDVPWFERRLENNMLDLYFMGYGHDYKKAMNDFSKVSGKAPIPPMYVFGYWYSKFQKYTEQDFKDLVTEIEEHDIPLDVMVVDTDWHLPGWTGWSWNKDYFPDPARFIAWLHEHKLKVPLNLHPSDGIDTYEDNFTALANELGLPTNQKIDWQLENKDFYHAFFKHILRPHEAIGVDFWWLDWQQELLIDDTDKIGNTFWINHVFFNDMKLNRNDRRPVAFHRWGGLGNHRYPIGFSGDMHSSYASLAYQTYFTATASNVGYGYWSHDVGGHIQPGPNDPELYLRWIQFGVFSPILRTHSADSPNIERRIWKYENFNLMLDAVKLRYALAPYIYTYARELYDTGISLCRPMYYDYPDKDEAYSYETQYMFGDNILVSPIVTAANATTKLSKKEIWLPEGKWYEAVSGEILEGGKSYTRTFTAGEIPYYYKQGAIIPQYPEIKNLKEKPEQLIIQFAPGDAGSFRYYEDDGDNSDYESGKYSFTRIEQTTSGNEGVYTIHPVEGSYDGMPTERSYKLEILGKKKPDEVKVNNSSYDFSNTEESGYWSYNEEKAIVTVFIPRQACSAKTEVKIKYPVSSDVDSPRQDATCFYNASTRQLQVRFSEAVASTLEVYNINGMKVFTADYPATPLVVQNMNECGLAQGIYICKIKTNGGNIVKKIQF